MSSTRALEVEFEDDIHHEKLSYTGETITIPFDKPSNAGKKRLIRQGWSFML